MKHKPFYCGLSRLEDGTPMLAILRIGRTQFLLWVGPKRLIKSARLQVHRVGGKRC